MKGKMALLIKNHKVLTAEIVIIFIAIIVLIILGILGVFNSNTIETNEQEKTNILNLSVTADENWTEDSTPAIVHIKGNCEYTKEIDFYHAVMPENSKTTVSDLVEVLTGKYEISVIPPINKDGSTYKTNGVITVDTDLETGENVLVDIILEYVKAEDVKDEELKETVSQIQTATEKGDESLDGEIGKNILNKMQININNNPNITDETKQETSNIIEESNTLSSSETTSNDNKSNVDNTSKDLESSTSDSDNSESSHVHTWVDHTATRWVSNIVTVVDEPAQTIQGARLYTKNADGNWIANGETYWFENGFTIDDFKSILKDKVKNEGYIGNYQNVTKTVPAVTHTEDQGYNETYVDYQYCSVCGQKR